MTVLPRKEDLTICFAHVAYRMADRFAARNTGIRHFQVNSLEELTVRIGDADVVSVSMLWRNNLIARAPKLKFIQSISAGTDQYSREALKAAGIRLASAQGVNARAVAEHAMSLILAMTRQLHFARDNQAQASLARHDLGPLQARGRARRQDAAGRRPRAHRLASRRARQGVRHAGDRHQARSGHRRRRTRTTCFRNGRLGEVLPLADFVALTCPLTPQTEGLINAQALAADEAVRVPDQRGARQGRRRAALIAALSGGRIAGAGLDCTVEEPLPATSALWDMPNVLITPHTAGETPPLRGQRDRSAAGESRSPLARRDGTRERDRLGSE